MKDDKPQPAWPFPNAEKLRFQMCPTDKVDEYRPEINRILAALGHPEALVTDESRFSDFVETENDLYDLMESPGLASYVCLSDFVWSAARFLREHDGDLP